jgi:hypothetical protein
VRSNPSHDCRKRSTPAGIFNRHAIPASDLNHCSFQGTVRGKRVQINSSFWTAGGVAAQEANPLQSPSPQEAASTSSLEAGPPELTPGIPQPSNGLVWILDAGGDKPGLSRLYISTGHPNLHRAKNFARAQFFADVVTTLDLAGSAATARIASHTPLIFVRKSVDQQEKED